MTKEKDKKEKASSSAVRESKGVKRKKKKVLVPKWKLFRAKEPLISVFMWGINHTIRELSCMQKPVMLLPNDFKAYSKIKVRNHLFNEINMPTLYKIKEYSPIVFQNIRDRFSVDSFEYLESLTSREPLPEVETKEPGSSRLFITFDNKFVIKIVDSEAVAEIHAILPQYHQYIVEMHGKTLLPQFLGLYRVTVDVTETYLLVMRNIFGGRYKIHRKYDLKGSTVQRQASEKERSKDLPTLKDNDFLQEEKYKVVLSDELKEKVMKLLKSDTEFLSRFHLMDYSLLIGIHDTEMAAFQQQQQYQPEHSAADESGFGAQHSAGLTFLSDPDSGDDQGSPSDSPIPPASIFMESFSTLSLEDEFYGLQSADGRFVFFMGLVDILTYYGVKKRTASAAKSVKYGAEAENISTVKPEQYARRLLEFINKNVHTSQHNMST